jgi:hypothetical protein
MTITLAFLIHHRLALLIERAHLRKSLHDDCEEQIKEEEATDNHQDREIDGCDEAACIHIVVHDVGPALQGNDSKDGQDSNSDIVKVEEPILDILPVF